MLLLGLGLLPAASLADEEEKKLGWKDEAQFSLVSTSGNAESTSFGLKNTAERLWEAAQLKLIFAAVRVESREGSRVAVEDGSGGFVVVDPPKKTTAENYLASGRYEHNISKSTFWFGGASWERDEPSGIENRYIAEGGVGTVWWDTDDLKFKTNYGLTLTDQEDVDEVPGQDDTFAGARFVWEYLNKWGKNTTYTNNLTIDESLEDSSNWRADMFQGLAVAMSERLALKLGLRTRYTHDPPLESLTLLDPAGNDTGTTVLAPLDELDTIFAASVVVQFD